MYLKWWIMSSYSEPVINNSWDEQFNELVNSLPIEPKILTLSWITIENFAEALDYHWYDQRFAVVPARRTVQIGGLVAESFMRRILCWNRNIIRNYIRNHELNEENFFEVIETITTTNDGKLRVSRYSPLPMNKADLQVYILIYKKSTFSCSNGF